MDIVVEKSDTEIAACYPVMFELRPHITEESFVAKVRTLEKLGYMLAYLKESGCPVAVTRFRLGENLAWGRFLYVDDLVTLSSQGNLKGQTPLLLQRTFWENTMTPEKSAQAAGESGTVWLRRSVK